MSYKSNFCLLFVGCMFLLLSATNSSANFSGINSDVFNPQSFQNAGSYQLSGIKFLPETYDDLGYSGRTYDNNNKAPTPSNNCDAYPLSACPANGTCKKCPWGSKYSLTSCQKNFVLSGSTCKAKTCKEIDSTYLEDIPANNSCTSVAEGSKTCYKDCKDCTSFALTSCPDKANCGQCGTKYKIDSCRDGLTVYPDAGCYPANCDDYPISYNSVGGNFASICSAYDTCWIPGMTKSVAKCTACNSDSTLQNNTCVASNAANVGDILFSDMTTSKDSVAGKTPIAIIFDVTNKLALGFDFKSDHWSTENGFFGTPSFEDTDDSEYRGQTDTAGKTNTSTLVNNGGSKVTAAYYCANYTTTGTTKGAWFLPSGAQIMSIYNNSSAINTKLTALGKTDVPSSIWSSTSCTTDGAFHINKGGLGCGKTGNGGKTDGTRSIIPVINYANLKPLQALKVTINISNDCPTGLTFSGTYKDDVTSGNISCNTKCYDKGGFNGSFSNDSETVTRDYATVTLTSLNSKITSIKSAVTGLSRPVSLGRVSFTLNTNDQTMEKYQSGYDFWTLQCKKDTTPLPTACPGLELTCSGRKYCCPTSTGIKNCSQLTSGTQQCLTEAIDKPI